MNHFAIGDRVTTIVVGENGVLTGTVKDIVADHQFYFVAIDEFDGALVVRTSEEMSYA